MVAGCDRGLRARLLDHQAVIRKEHVLGQASLGFGMREFVGHVDEVRACRADFAGDVHGLVKRQVCGVFAFAEAVEDEGLGPGKPSPTVRGHSGDVRAIGKWKERRRDGETERRS